MFNYVWLPTRQFEFQIFKFCGPFSASTESLQVNRTDDRMSQLPTTGRLNTVCACHAVDE